MIPKKGQKKPLTTAELVVSGTTPLDGVSVEGVPSVDGVPPLVPPDGVPPLVPPDGVPPLVPPDGVPPLVPPDGVPPLVPPDGVPPLVPPDGTDVVPGGGTKPEGEVPAEPVAREPV